MKIYFATHSTTKDNEAHLSSGWKDIELSDLGIQQSKELGERFIDIKIDLACCSDLKRAVDTVKLAFEDKYPVIVDKRLKELNYGDFNGKSSEVVEPMKVKHTKEPFPNGESYELAIARTHEFYRELKEKYPDNIVLIVGHRATQYGLDTNVPFKWQPYWEYDL